MMLAVVFMLIVRARDPNTWQWLAPGDGEPAPAAKPAHPAVEVVRPDEPEPAEAVVSGPTDEDPEEQEFVKEAFQAIEDYRLAITPTEMPAYERVVQWAINQPYQQLAQRSRRDVKLARLMNAPDEYRGKLVGVTLNVKRVEPWDLKIYADDSPRGPDAKPEKVLKLYEAWGTTWEGKAWPYLVILVDVPPEMPIGDGIEEKVSFAGYFFKIQKYYDKLHRENHCPVLIGRAQWEPAPAGPKLTQSDVYATYAIIAAVVLIAVIGLLSALLGRKRRPALAGSAAMSSAAPGIEEWFDQPEGEGNKSTPSGDSILGDAGSNGHSKGNGRPFPHGLDADHPPGE